MNVLFLFSDCINKFINGNYRKNNSISLPPSPTATLPKPSLTSSSSSQKTQKIIVAVDNYHLFDKNTPFTRVKLHRQYTICSDDDFDNISYGFCPKYALSWDHESNKQYWDEGHDYLAGWSDEEIYEAQNT